MVPKIVDHEERRLTIAHACSRVIADDGLVGVTMRSVATAAGITTGAVTHYYESKAELLGVALELVATETLDRVRSVQPVDFDAFLYQLELTLPTTGSRRDEWKVWLAFWSECARGDRRLLAHNRQFHSEWLSVLETSIRRVNGDSADPIRAAERLAFAVNAIGLEACVDPKSWSRHRQRLELVSAVGLIGIG